MDLKKTTIYFIDKEKEELNLAIDKVTETNHTAAYEYLFHKKYTNSQYIYDENNQIYIPKIWDNFHITKDLVKLGYVIFLNQGDNKAELVLPNILTTKEKKDIINIQNQLNEFKIKVWQINGEQIIDYDEIPNINVNAKEILNAKVRG